MIFSIDAFAVYSPTMSSMGEMNRANAQDEQLRMTDRFTSTLVIIAAVRLARDDISRPSPRLSSVVADSVGLARKILERAIR